jgi:hypothetical protein
MIWMLHPARLDVGDSIILVTSLIGKMQHQAVNATGTGSSPCVLHQTRVNLLSSLEKT